MTYKQDAQDAIYAPDAYRASDHNPTVVGLDLVPMSVLRTVSPTAPNLNDTVTLTDTLPAEVDFAYWVAQPVGAALEQGAISWTGTLTDGHTLTFTFAVTNTVTQAQVTNTAYFSGTLHAGSDAAVYNAGRRVNQSDNVTEGGSYDRED